MIAAIVSSTVSAKVTYDDAITSNESYYSQTEQVHTTPSTEGLEGFELQNDSGGEWKHLWSGSTTGSISIPSNTKEVFVITSVGKTHTFPKNVGSITLDTVSNSRAVAKATFNGNAVSGETKTVRWTGSCASENHTNCSKSATATIKINKVMVK